MTVLVGRSLGSYEDCRSQPLSEGNSEAFTFAVTRAQVGTVSVNYAVTGIGAIEPLQMTLLVTSFQAAQSRQTTRLITIPVRGDLIGEANSCKT